MTIVFPFTSSRLPTRFFSSTPFAVWKGSSATSATRNSRFGETVPLGGSGRITTFGRAPATTRGRSVSDTFVPIVVPSPVGAVAASACGRRRR